MREPVDEKDRQALDHLRARRDRLAQRIEDMKNDIEHWNRVHPHEEPFNVDEFLAEPRRVLAEIDAGLGL